MLVGEVPDDPGTSIIVIVGLALAGRPEAAVPSAAQSANVARRRNPSTPRAIGWEQPASKSMAADLLSLPVRLLTVNIGLIVQSG
jgi:hypothetical protein